MSLLQGHLPYIPPDIIKFFFFSVVCFCAIYFKNGHMVIICLDSGIASIKDQSWGFQEMPPEPDVDSNVAEGRDPPGRDSCPDEDVGP